MKSKQTNTWKLGLFVTIAITALCAAIWWLGLSRFDKETFSLVTYFNESVQGLDVGAPVKMRGVRIGNVHDIGFGPDGLTVEVTSDLYVATLKKLGLEDLRRPDPDTGRYDFGDLRARVAMQGITGTCFLAVDSVPGIPMPKFKFPLPPNYLPAAPSTLSRLEEGAVGIAEKLPGIVANLDRVLTKLANDFDVGGLSTSATKLLTDLDEKVLQLDFSTLQKELTDTLVGLRTFAENTDHILAQFRGDPPPLKRLLDAVESLALGVQEELEKSDLSGTTAELRGTSRALGQLARDADLLTGEAALDLAALRQTLTALGSLLELLERNPSALLRGRKND